MTDLHPFLTLTPALGCIHRFSAKLFRPATQLDTYESLDATLPTVIGARSRASPHDLRWYTIDVHKASVASARCCASCNPSSPLAIMPCDVTDSRLRQYAQEFYYPNINESERSSSSVSTCTARSYASSVSHQHRGKLVVTAESRVQLNDALIQWRKDQLVEGEVMISCDFYLPPGPLKALVDGAKAMAGMEEISEVEIRKLTPLQQLDEGDMQSLLRALMAWKATLSPVPPPESRPTPQSQRRESKRSRIYITANRETSPSPQTRSPCKDQETIQSLQATPRPTPRPRPVPKLITPQSTPHPSQNPSLPFTPALSSPSPWYLPSTPATPHPPTPLSSQPLGFFNMPHPPAGTASGHYRKTDYESSPGRKSFYRAQTMMYPPHSAAGPSTISTPTQASGQSVFSVNPNNKYYR